MNSLLAYANTPFRPYQGPFNMFGELAGPGGIVLLLEAGGTLALPVNEAGKLNGTATSSVTTTVSVSAPGIAPVSERDFVTTSELVSGTLFDYMRETDDFQTGGARIAYLFLPSGDTIDLRFDVTQTVDSLVIEGLTFSGSVSLNATLTAPFDGSRGTPMRYHQSTLFFTDFIGSSDIIDTVDHSLSHNSVAVDLEGGTGGNASGGTDRYLLIDNVVGTSFQDTLMGNAQNNVFVGAAGNDTIMGRLGTDTVEFATARALSNVTRWPTTMHIDGPEGFDQLSDIERLRFSDKGLAFDLGPSDAAGMTVRVIGAAFDTQYMTPELVGEGISIFDSGLSMLRVCELAIGTPLFRSLAGSDSNVDFVNAVYRNIVGVLPSALERDSLVGLLQGSGGSMAQAQLLMLAANNPNNDINIGLVGLQQTGVDFV